jgi:hypothetical protein
MIPVTAAMFANDGLSVFALSNGMLYSATSPTSFTLIASGVATLQGQSPDGKSLLVSKGTSQTTGLSDLYLLANKASSPFITISMAQSVAFGADLFTADGNYVLFGTNETQVGTNYFVGDFDSFAVAGASSPSTLGTKNWQAYGSSGSKTVYNDNWQAEGSFNPTADIETRDLATNGPPTKLVSQADQNFYLTADKKQIVYSWTYCATDAAGVYVTAAP